MVKRRRFKKVKIVELPSKVKEVKEIPKKGSELEKEVVEEESKIKESFQDLTTTGNFPTTVLSSDEPAPQNPQVRERETTPAIEDQPLFRESALYSNNQPAPTAQSRYITSEESARSFQFNSTLSNSNDISTTARSINDFRGEEAKVFGGEKQVERYAKPADIQAEKPRKKYPWEI